MSCSYFIIKMLISQQMSSRSYAIVTVKSMNDTNKKTVRKKLPVWLVATTIAILLGMIAATVIFWEPLSRLLGNPHELRDAIDHAGPWGPLLFILVQLLQVIIAPIPGQISGFVGGLAFGTVWGTIYSLIGAAIGFTLIFIFARKLGRPFVERFVHQDLLKKFDYLTESGGAFVFFLIFLLPAFPDDIICYLAGLSKIKISTLIIISLLGRLPGYFVLSLSGAGVAESNIQLTLIVVTVLMVIGAVGIWQRKRLEQWVKRLSHK